MGVVTFVYPNPRAGLSAEVAAGKAPDTELLGQNHLADLGIEAAIHDPALKPAGGALARRLLWHLRELTIPWELPADADVVFTPLAGLLPLAARARRRVRMVVVNYGLCTIWDRSGAARRRLLAATLRSAATIVCLGDSQRERLLRQTGLPGERVVTVRLGVDERFFAPRPPGENPLVLAVGKDLARDYATLIEAIRPLGVRATIACLPRNLEGLSLSPGVEARVVSPFELRALYAEAGCVVVPQRRADYSYGSEGGGLTALLEAMATGRPVVATDRPIIRDYVADEQSALLVPPEDPSSLRAAIVRILGDGDLAASLGHSARQAVERGLTTRHFAAGIAPILRRHMHTPQRAAQFGG